MGALVELFLDMLPRFLIKDVSACPTRDPRYDELAHQQARLDVTLVLHVPIDHGSLHAEVRTYGVVRASRQEALSSRADSIQQHAKGFGPGAHFRFRTSQRVIQHDRAV